MKFDYFLNGDLLGLLEVCGYSSGCNKSKLVFYGDTEDIIIGEKGVMDQIKKRKIF